MSVITIERKILEKNDEVASYNRETFNKKGIKVLNLVSSPGSGKTSLLEKTIKRLKDTMRIAVITGDLQTNLDAQRIDALGVPSVQIITNGSCHLDAMLVRNAYQKIANFDLDILFIENVGNLVCPAEFDLGEMMKVVVTSVTEGEDKPLKYPVMFRKSDVLIINKIDLIPYLKISVEEMKKNALSINNNLKIFDCSCVTEEGLDKWCEYLTNLKLQ